MAQHRHLTRPTIIALLAVAALLMAMSSWPTVASGQALHRTVAHSPEGIEAATPLPGTNDTWLLGYTGEPDQNLEYRALHVHNNKVKQFAGPKVGRYGTLQVVYAVSRSEVLIAGGRQAVGIQELPALYRFNGKKFAAVKLPRNLANGAVAIDTLASSSPNNIWAGGAVWGATSSGPITLHWTGHAWVEEAMEGTCDSVTTTGPSNGFCIVTNTDGGSQVIEAWNGKVWTADLTVPAGEDLRGVAMASPTNAWAVGERLNSGSEGVGAVVYHFNGKSWTLVKLPKNTPGNGGLTSIAMVRSQAWALGSTASSKHYVLHWTGGKWVLQHVPVNSSYELTAISAAGHRGPVIGGSHYIRSTAREESVLLQLQRGSWVVGAS